ncbi:dihydroorotate dehydrogenase [Gorillibacterium massiliense]|uniref:dihydroorotate dehydrogenase n=1 Tax=Gorillibacterium massiliense TaxID=1280390 RepID=UPI0004B68F6C|nr:dihydroorotate dehydrogenase [Gorillibacterium massiliense]
MISLACEIAGVKLNNPFIMASGTYGFGKEYSAYCDLNKLGGISGKGLTLHPKAGNKGTRIFETASGMLNSVGLENPGIEAFLAHELDEMVRWNTAVLINLGGGTIGDYVEGAALISEDNRIRRLDNRRGADMIELNISCPNVKEGGLAFGVETETARQVVREVRRATDMPLIVKLSPNAQDIRAMAVMCEEEGADGISLINTFSAMKIDIKRRRSVFDNLYAGLSGPAIKPIALRMVHQAAKAVSIPVIGMGGIVTAEDAVEFIMAGAAAVQVGTANFMNLRVGEELADDLYRYMEAEKIASLEEIRGII